MLQIVVYMPIIRVNLPPNAEIFLESMRHVAEFEFFDSHAFINFAASVLGLPDHDDKNPNAEEYKGAGFTSLEFHENMGYLFIVMSCMALALLTIAILSIWKPKAKKMLQKIKKRWIWSYTLRFISVCYIFTLIAFALATLENGVVFTLIGVIGLAIYPVWTVFFLFYNRSLLSQKDTLEKYWSLYGTLRFKETFAMLYPFVNCARKACYVFGAIYLKEWAVFQVQLFTLLNGFYIIYFAGCHPNKRIYDFRLELFNEWAIQIMCFLMMCFTDMVQLDTEPLINYKLGEVFKIFAMTVIVINLLVILAGMAPTIKAFLRRRKFRKDLPTLIARRMQEREAKTNMANENLKGKLQSIFDDEVVQHDAVENAAAPSKEEQLSDNFKKQFYMQMQAKIRSKELKQFQNLNEGVDSIQKKVEKQRKRDKMAKEADEIFSSSSDEEGDKSMKTPKKIKHIYSHKSFKKSTNRNSLASITEEDLAVGPTMNSAARTHEK